MNKSWEYSVDLKSQNNHALSTTKDNGNVELNWKILSLVYLGITANFACLFYFVALHTIYLSGKTFNSPPLLNMVSSLALFDAPAMLIGAFLAYKASKQINFISLMKIAALINITAACLILYSYGIYKTDCNEFLMGVRFVQMSLFSATLILPTMFCFSITPQKYHHKLSYFTPMAYAFAGILSFFVKKELIFAEIKSYFLYYAFSGLVSFLCFFLSPNIKCQFFYQPKKNHNQISEFERSTIKLTLFLSGFLLAGGTMYVTHFSASYMSEMLMVNLPGKLSPNGFHCLILVLFLPVSSYLYNKFGLAKVMLGGGAILIIQAAINYFNPSISNFIYLLLRITYAIGLSLAIAPLYLVIYRLSTKTGKLYKPLLWTIGGFSFAMILRSAVFLLFPENIRPIFTTTLMLLTAIFAYILLIPKISALLNNEKSTGV